MKVSILINKSEKIAVIGGGLAGLVIANGLIKKGYQNVTVFEKECRLGGKLHTIWYNGKSYECGAHFGLSSQKYLKQLMKYFKIKIDGPKLSRANYSLDGQKKMQIPKEDLALFMEELDRLPILLANYPSLERANLFDLEDDLMIPFSDWCTKHELNLLKVVYAHYFTSYGLGNVEEMPTLYVLKILNYDNLMSFMELPEFCTWKNGVQTLIDCLARTIKDIRLTQGVESIIPIENGQIFVSTAYEKNLYDKVIITAPLNIYESTFKDDPEMVSFLKEIKYHTYNVYGFRVNEVRAQSGCIIDNLKKERAGHIVIWNARWDIPTGEQLVMTYAYQNPAHNGIESLQLLKNDLSLFGFKDPILYHTQTWAQCPYVSTELLKRGFYNKLESKQGYKNIYLAGEIMSTVSMENTLKYAYYLVNKYF